MQDNPWTELSTSNNCHAPKIWLGSRKGLKMSALPSISNAGEIIPAVSSTNSVPQTTAKSLYVGNLSCFVSEDMLREIFSTLGRVAECKVIKDKTTGFPAGYGFVRFEDHRSAELALASINGRVLYNQELRVNWAFQKEQAEDTSAHFHIFVGDLSAEVNDFFLKQAFSEYSECSDARVLWDHLTGRSKSYGFVSFRTKEAAEDAIRRFNGAYIGHRRVRCSWAQHKQDPSANNYATVDQNDPTNSNVYVGNLAPSVTDQELRQLFQRYGSVQDVKLYRKGSYAFVQFQQHTNAVNAIIGLNGRMIKGKALKCAWGRHQARQTPMNLAMLSMMGPQVMQNQQPLLLAPTNQLQAQPNINILQQQLAGLALGNQMQPQGLGHAAQQSAQQDTPAQLDPAYLYNVQPQVGGMMIPGPGPAMYYPQ